ncbi:MAG: hypothetical protein GY862_19510, partial [Gammaproteobacteria bacterium]|nr:hypothetical protein [Gammaproteobacteria bacterium]
MNITRLTPLLVLLLACAMYFITYFVLNSGDSFSLEIIMKYEKPAQVQIFWDSGARFNAQENTSFAADPGEHRYNIDIPKNINGIRIDPMQAPGVVFIKKIELKGIAASYRWDFSNMFSGWSDHSQIKLTGLDEINGLKIESMGNDPTFSNNRWAEAESHLHEQTIIIGIIIAGLSVLAVVAACKGVRLKVLAGLFQICVITAVSFGLSEAALRAYNAYHPSFIFYDASYNRFRGRPHAKDFDFTLNSKGFKDIEFKSKQKDTFRIVAIGDSFAYGIVPYRYNYLTVLEERFY